MCWRTPAQLKAGEKRSRNLETFFFLAFACMASPFFLAIIGTLHRTSKSFHALTINDTLTASSTTSTIYFRICSRNCHTAVTISAMTAELFTINLILYTYIFFLYLTSFSPGNNSRAAKT